MTSQIIPKPLAEILDTTRSERAGSENYRETIPFQRPNYNFATALTSQGAYSSERAPTPQLSLTSSEKRRDSSCYSGTCARDRYSLAA